MRVRQPLDRSLSLYGPDTMKAVCRGFDEAWATIAPSVGTDPRAVDEARLRLAESVVAVTGHDSTNVPQIKSLALIMDVEKRFAHVLAARSAVDYQAPPKPRARHETDAAHAVASAAIPARGPDEDGRRRSPSRGPRARLRARLRRAQQTSGCPSGRAPRA
jgi:hypothetical protein